MRKNYLQVLLPPAVDLALKTIELPAKGTIIHLRVLLPGEVTDLRLVSLNSAAGGKEQRWNFQTKVQEP